MSLVNYSSSEDDKKDSTSLKRKRELPPLPASFHDLYASTTRLSTNDNPELHGGRKRHIPHIQGNWPTHVFLEWRPASIEFKYLSDLVHRANKPSESKNDGNPIHSLLENELSTPLPLHISLSRSLVLQTQHRERFLERVTRKVRATRVRPFVVKFSSLAWFPNHDKSRWFLSLRAARPANDELNRLLGASNGAARDLQLPTLYLGTEAEKLTSPSLSMKSSPNKETHRIEDAIAHQKTPDRSDFLHVSLAWSLSKPSDSFDDDVSSVEDVQQLSVLFDTVKVKMGNTVSTITLSAKTVEEQTGILG